MQSSSTSSHTVFANTGVQILCFPLDSKLRFTADQVDFGWQRCKCQANGKTEDYHYIQWQITSENQLLLAIDTTIGPPPTVSPDQKEEPNTGYFCTGEMLGDFEVSLDGLLGVNGEPLAGLDGVDFIIRSASSGGSQPKEVDLVIDFGNNRTGGLLIEFHGDVKQEPFMHPLQLIHRYHLDSWDEKGDLAANQGRRWFSSRSHWCAPPYRLPPRIENVVWVKEKQKKMLGGEKEVARQTTVFATPEIFQDFSQVRLGREAHDLSLVMRTEGEVRTSLSSPKRYLWAKDASWLDGAIWHMADPVGQYDKEHHAALLQGPLLEYIPPDDLADEPGPDYDGNPSKPNHAPRALMHGALYEILAQAYSYINSPSYRRTAGESQRMRRLRSLTLTYPSGMILPEREELTRQARKAIHLFKTTAGKHQEVDPEFHLSIDEASAVHLTYIWSEIQKLGRNPKLWFELMGRNDSSDETAESNGADAGESGESGESDETATSVAMPAGRRRGAAAEEGEPPVKESRRRRERPRRATRGRDRGSKSVDPTASTSSDLPAVRVACIDIGGGTSDLMIAEYRCETRTGGDRVVGKTLHRDGIYMAGDHLVKRLLECIVVPAFADAVGMEDRDIMRLFGPEVPDTRQIRAQRVTWINRFFVPLAQKYLEFAVDNVTDEEICHTDPDLVATEVVESLQATINEMFGAGHCQIDQPLGLYFDSQEFEDIVDEVFGDLLMDFCETIVEHNADIVLLAGLPTKLDSIQELVRTYLPLHNSRIVPMYHRYVGTWYPYQNPDDMNPGVIVDPKSTVVVGAAVEFSAKNGMLSQFKFGMEDEASRRSYYWGVMTGTRIDEHQVLFASTEAIEQPPSNEEHVLNVSDRSLIIGRKRLERWNAQATPVYVVKVHVGQRLGEIDVDVTLTRTRGAEGEEELEVKSVDGDVAGERAVLGENVTFEWRTLADENYYLDTGGLDKIELGT